MRKFLSKVLALLLVLGAVTAQASTNVVQDLSDAGVAGVASALGVVGLVLVGMLGIALVFVVASLIKRAWRNR